MNSPFLQVLSILQLVKQESYPRNKKNRKENGALKI
ncbi:MAG: hypothetical protein JWQ40_1704 [Segetibacter sp.]|nr:hypothetical protein [Segetibacter sp.]